MVRCPGCGSDNPAGSRFCNRCGRSFAVHDSGDVRKTVTVLFADVVSSTARGERTDPESTRRLLARYFAAIRAVIEHHGGTVEKFIGDAVMAVFGVPTLHEDDALRAVLAARQRLASDRAAHRREQRRGRGGRRGWRRDARDR
jgi:class 3 adenylate cyclase